MEFCPLLVRYPSFAVSVFFTPACNGNIEAKSSSQLVYQRKSNSELMFLIVIFFSPISPLFVEI